MHEITTIRLDATKNRHHANNEQSVGSVASLLSHGWDLAGSFEVGEDVVIFMRLKRWRWKFWRKPAPPPGMKSYPVYRR